MTGTPDRQVVERLLTKLLSTAWAAAGLSWTAAQDSMVVTVVDGVAEMIATAVESHREDAPHIYADGSTS